MASRPTPPRLSSTHLSQSQSQSPPPSPPSLSSRSPDATPVPLNPNPRLPSAIPSLASRRISTPPATRPTARSSPKVGSPATPLRQKPSMGHGKCVPSVAGSMRSLRATSLQLVSTAMQLTSDARSLIDVPLPPNGSASVLSDTSNTVSTASSVNGNSNHAPHPIIPDDDFTPLPEDVPSPTVSQLLGPSTSLSPPAKRQSSVNTPVKPRVSHALHNTFTPPYPNKGVTPKTDVVVIKATTPKISTPLVTRTPFSPQSQKTLQTTPSRNPSTPKVSLTVSPIIRGSSPGPVPFVPWSNSGALNVSTNGNGINPSMYSGSGVSREQSLSGSMWDAAPNISQYDYSRSPGNGHLEDDEMSMELYTEVDASELDEDIHAAFEEVRMIFMRKLIHYKRLLEQAQTSSASQLHALQAELRLLRLQIEAERKTLREVEAKAGRDREALLVERRNRNVSIGHQSNDIGSFDIISALRGDGKGTFDEADVRKVVRSLPMPDRMRLIHLILDACLPGDISQMIRLLEKYAATTFDLITSLPPEIAARILSHLSVHELLAVELVSKSWQAVVHHPAIWRRLCLDLTRNDPVPLKWPADASEWEPLYKSIHHRERNFAGGYAQSLRFLRGHTNFCTTLILKGNRLISGSYDETIRFWDIRSGRETHCLKAKAISCLDFLPEEEVLVAGFHDVGRVQVYSTVTWALLQTLQGHLYGIRSVAITSQYVVTAGADKAIVCWDWRSGQKIVRFGQQTNLNIGVQIVDDETVVGVTVDGIVRTFSIRKKEMINQFKLNELVTGDPILSSRIAHVGVGANNMLQWFAAKGKQITCATKTLILHLEWNEYDKPPSPSQGSPDMYLSPITTPATARDRASLSRSTSTSPLISRKSLPGRHSLAASTSSPISPAKPLLPRTYSTTNMTIPPKVLAVIDTPDVAVGAVDPLKRRVVTATRFSSRAGADRKLYMSTYDEHHMDRLFANATLHSEDENELQEQPNSHITTIGGAWASCATGMPDNSDGIHNIPPDFKGLATPSLNPMSMALSHEEVVAGCADGTIYIMSFVGYKYGKRP